MTHDHNLPAPIHLPDGDPDGFGAAGIPMSQAPAVALAFALGYACARPQSAHDFGPFCAVVEELMTRPSGETDPGPIGGWDRRSLFGLVMSLLPTELSRAVVMLYQAQKGQRWHRTGQYRTTSGNS